MLSSENVPAKLGRLAADIGGESAGFLKVGDCLSFGVL